MFRIARGDDSQVGEPEASQLGRAAAARLMLDWLDERQQQIGISSLLVYPLDFSGLSGLLILPLCLFCLVLGLSLALGFDFWSYGYRKILLSSSKAVNSPNTLWRGESS